MDPNADLHLRAFQVNLRLSHFSQAERVSLALGRGPREPLTNQTRTCRWAGGRVGGSWSARRGPRWCPKGGFATPSVPHSKSVPPGRSSTTWGPSKHLSGWLVTLVTSSCSLGLCALHTNCGHGAATRERPCGAPHAPTAVGRPSGASAAVAVAAVGVGERRG